jgi:hypothetical protein
VSSIAQPTLKPVLKIKGTIVLGAQIQQKCLTAYGCESDRLSDPPRNLVGGLALQGNIASNTGALDAIFLSLKAGNCGESPSTIPRQRSLRVRAWWVT